MNDISVWEDGGRVDWIHLVGVGVGRKKPRGSLGLEICIFATIRAIQRGQYAERTKSQRKVYI